MERAEIDSIENFSALLKATNRRTAARHDLPAVHGDILSYLSRCNAWSDNVLAAAQYLGLTKGTVSQSVKLLSERGYIERRPDERDRRMQHLLLTEKGRAYVSELDADIHERLKGVEIGGPYTRVFKAIIADLTRQAQRALDSGPSFGTCRTCRHYKRTGEGAGSCGKMDHTLSDSDMDRLCRLYAWAE